VVLSGDQVRRFGEDGYLVVPGVVPENLLAAVDREIDALAAADPPPAGTVGKHFWFLPPRQLPASDAALRHSGALDIAAELVAPHTLDLSLDHIQIALNYPPHDHRPGGPHVDGHGPDQERPYSFTMLAAVYLVDEQESQAGNIWVWPGSHLDHQRLFQERGTRALLPVSGHSTMLESPPALREQVPVMARRGDLLLAQFLLGHNTGGNTTDRVRRIAYYRLAAPVTRPGGRKRSSTPSPSTPRCVASSPTEAPGATCRAAPEPDRRHRASRRPRESRRLRPWCCGHGPGTCSPRRSSGSARCP
jgi:Phytanoyl-CoA dioxygenase (PhyH)